MRIVRITNLEWRDAFAIVLAFLAAFTDAKIGPIQLAELFIITFAIWHSVVYLSERATPLNALAKRQLRMALIFIAIICVGAFVGLFNNIYFTPIAADSILKKARLRLARSYYSNRPMHLFNVNID
jgi:hypothetical protein